MRIFFVLSLLGCLTAPVLAQDDASALFVSAKCSVCHEIGVGAEHKIGPHLNGIVGRTVGGLKDYNYSSALDAARAEGMVWTPELLLQYFKKPSNAFPGTKMTFAGMASRADINALIAYLGSIGADGSPAQ